MLNTCDTKIDNIEGMTFGPTPADGKRSPMMVSGVGSVPEPATWAMMIAGFGMVGAATRYRRKSARITALFATT